jgi:hypothetical protein
VSWLPPLRRIFRVVAISLIVLPVGVAALIQVRQRIFRHRAERLLDDVRSVQLRRSTWQDAQRVMARWDEWATFSRFCSRENCTVRIELDELMRFRLRHPDTRRYFIWLERLFGGREATVFAGLTVFNGVIWEKEYGVVIAVAPKAEEDGDFGYLLFANARTVPHPRERSVGHPEYSDASPGGCEGCLGVIAQFTPYADDGVIGKLMDFNLACLTRWRPCRNQADVLPYAWTLHKDETRENELTWKRLENCNYPLELLARDAENAAVVDVVSEKPNHRWPERSITVVRLVGKLKRALFWESNATREVWDMKSETAKRGRGKPFTSRRVILLFSSPTETMSGIQTDSCGVVSYTGENISAVADGAARDYLATHTKQEIRFPLF